MPSGERAIKAKHRSFSHHGAHNDGDHLNHHDQLMHVAAIYIPDHK